MFILRCKKWNIFSIILIYFHMCVTFYSAEYIPRFSKRRVLRFFFSLASDHANRMREISFTRPYIVGRKRDGERDIKVSRNLVPS